MLPHGTGIFDQGLELSPYVMIRGLHADVELFCLDCCLIDCNCELITCHHRLPWPIDRLLAGKTNRCSTGANFPSCAFACTEDLPNRCVRALTWPVMASGAGWPVAV